MSDPTMTPAEMRSEADRLEKQATALTARAQQLRGVADQIERLQRALTSGNSYVTDDDMSSTQNSVKHPGPRAVKGPMAALQKELGLSSLRELAEAMGEEHQNVRSWNHRGGAPSRVDDKIAKLRAAHQKRAAKK